MKFIDVLQNKNKLWRRPCWEADLYFDPEFCEMMGYNHVLTGQDMCASDWVEYKEEKPPMRVYEDSYGTILLTDKSPSSKSYRDITESLAAALAPYIKKILEEQE